MIIMAEEEGGKIILFGKFQWTDPGATGQIGHHVQQHVGWGRPQEEERVRIPLRNMVATIALEMTIKSILVSQETAQVYSLCAVIFIERAH